MSGRQSLAAVFAAPAVIAVLSLIGLVGALLGDGAWDALGAALLLVWLVVALWGRLFRVQQARPQGQVGWNSTSKRHGSL